MNHADGAVARDEIGYAPELTIEGGMRYTIDMLRQKAGFPSVG
jgi:hypothetical protein